MNEDRNSKYVKGDSVIMNRSIVTLTGDHLELA